MSRDVIATNVEHPSSEAGRSWTGSPRPLSLRVNISWTLAGNVILAGCKWGIIVALARLENPVMVGQFALALAITAPIILFANLELRTVQATDARRDYRFKEYLGVRLVTTILALVAIAAVLLVADYSREVAIIIMLVGIAKAFEALGDVIHGRLQLHERMDLVAVSRALKGLLGLAAIATVLYVTGSLVWALLAFASLWLAALLTYDVRSLCRVLSDRRGNHHLASLWPSVSRARLGQLAMLSSPLGLVMLLSSLNINIPRYFLEHSVGTYELGVFAALAYLIVGAGIPVNAAAQSTIPRLARHVVSGNRIEFIKLTAKLLAAALLVGLFAVAVAWAAGHRLLQLIYGPEYAPYADVLVLIMVAATVMNAARVLQNVMTAARKIKVQVLIFASVLLLTVALCAWLIPQWGLAGAAMALMFGGALQLLCSLLVIAHWMTRSRGVAEKVSSQAYSRVQIEHE